MSMGYSGMTLTNIFDVDEKNQVITANVWLDQVYFAKRSYQQRAFRNGAMSCFAGILTSSMASSL